MVGWCLWWFRFPSSPPTASTNFKRQPLSILRLPFCLPVAGLMLLTSPSQTDISVFSAMSGSQQFRDYCFYSSIHLIDSATASSISFRAFFGVLPWVISEGNSVRQGKVCLIFFRPFNPVGVFTGWVRHEDQAARAIGCTCLILRAIVFSVTFRS